MKSTPTNGSNIPSKTSWPSTTKIYATFTPKTSKTTCSWSGAYYTEAVCGGAGGKRKRPGSHRDKDAQTGEVPPGDQRDVGMDEAAAGGPDGTSRQRHRQGSALQCR